MKPISRMLAGVALAASLAEAQSDRTYLEALVLLSEAASTPSEIAEALARLERARPDFEEVARYHLALAELHFKNEDTEAAELAIRSAIEAEPDLATSYLALGRLLEREGDLEGAQEALRKASELSPVVSNERLVLADFYLRAERSEEARELLESMTADDPDAIAAWRRLGDIAINRGDYETAERAAERVLERLPGDIPASVARARVHGALGRTQEAIALLESLAAAHPEDGLVHFELGRAYLQAGDLRRGRELLARASTLSPEAPGPQLLLADSYLQSGELTLALGALDSVLGDERVAREALRILGSVYAQGDDPERALDAWESYRRVAPEDPVGPYSVARALEELGRVGEAERELENALALDPTFVSALAELVRIALEKNQPSVALARLRKQLESVPASAPLYRLLAELKRKTGDAQGAETTYRRALELDGSSVEIYVGLAGLLLESGRTEDALALLEEARGKWSDDPRILILVASSKQRLGSGDEARRIYERVLELDPRNLAATNNLAYLLLDQGDPERALELAEKALRIDPDNPDIIDTVAWIYYRRGSYRAARTLMSSVVEKRPQNPEIHYHMGMILFRLGERAEAARHLERSLELDPETEFAEEARRVLATIRSRTSAR